MLAYHRTPRTRPANGPRRCDGSSPGCAWAASPDAALRPYRHLAGEFRPVWCDRPQIRAEQLLRLPPGRRSAFIPGVWEKLGTAHITQDAHQRISPRMYLPWMSGCQGGNTAPHSQQMGIGGGPAQIAQCPRSQITMASERWGSSDCRPCRGCGTYRRRAAAHPSAGCSGPGVRC